MCAGLLSCYVLGTAWYVAVYARAGETASVTAVLSACVLPFIPTAIVKAVLACAIGLNLRKRIPGRYRLHFARKDAFAPRKTWS